MLIMLFVLSYSHFVIFDENGVVVSEELNTELGEGDALADEPNEGVRVPDWEQEFKGAIQTVQTAEVLAAPTVP